VRISSHPVVRLIEPAPAESVAGSEPRRADDHQQHRRLLECVTEPIGPCVADCDRRNVHEDPARTKPASELSLKPLGRLRGIRAAVADERERL
jgi:hypothetical protein